MLALLDRAHFDHMTGGDAALQMEVAALFRTQAAAWTHLLTPGENWRDAAHTMKGSARGIGLVALAHACETAEAAPEAEAALALPELRAALEQALAALDAL